jgi:hypothetical protein
MRDLATSVREYYDQAADPVTAEEVFRRLEGDLEPVMRDPRPLRPVWVVAVAAALVLIVIGGVGLLGLLRDDAVVTDEPMPTTTLPTTSLPSNDFTTMIVPELPVQGQVSLALTTDQKPVVLYGAESQDRAVLVTCSESTCSSFVETMVSEFATFGHVSDVAIGADGLPTFAFVDFEDETFTAQGGVVHCSDPTCAVRTVEVFDIDVEGMEPTLTMDPQGLPAAVFSDWSDDGQVGTYVLVRCQDPMCSDHTTGTIADAGGPPVLSFDALEMPMLAFSRNRRDARTADLVMVTCSDAVCSQGGSSALVVESPLNTRSVDMVLATDGTPTFVFGEPKLQVAHCLEPSCSSGTEVSFISLDAESAVDMEIGADGLLIIAYTYLAPDFVRELRVASCADVACSEGTVEVLASDSWMVSIDMTLSSTGNPVVAYQAGTAMGITSCPDPACALASQRSLQWTQAEFKVPETAVAEASGWSQLETFAGGISPSGIRATATGAQGVIAVGNQAGSPTAWVSSDGDVWTEFTIASEGEVFSVVAGGSGFVVVGSTCSDMAISTSDTPPCDPAIWTSSDGAAIWTLTSTTDQFGGCSSLATPPEFGCQTWVESVILTATGFLATGYDIIGGTEQRNVAWTSSDGLTWQREVPAPATNRPPYPKLVADAPWQDGLYGLGTQCTEQGSSLVCQPFGWTSIDGATWEPVELDPLDFGASDHAAFIEDGIHLVSGDFGLLALGSNIDPTTWEETPMMFLSEDGIRWTPFRLEPDMWGTNALLSLGDRVMALGVSGVWVWVPG